MVLVVVYVGEGKVRGRIGFRRDMIFGISDDVLVFWKSLFEGGEDFIGLDVFNLCWEFWGRFIGF